MIEQDWDGFTAFGGTLDRSILRCSPYIKTDVHNFYTWLSAMRERPLKYGIPEKHKQDVAAVLDKFMIPREQIGIQGLPLFLLPPVLDKMIGDKREVDPVIVKFGPDLRPLQLVDGASALGYLFSITQAPFDASCQSYWIWMLVFFSECLQLAFTIDFKDEVVTSSGGPFMANVMYLPPTTQLALSQQQPFAFGATVPTDSFHSDEDKAAAERRGLAITWRCENVLAQALSKLSTEQKVPVLSHGNLIAFIGC
ncbi:hypothetical protein CC86DRAFT_399910 [Ophiobolus disseminans]|uniref:Uncharacterized protein n=1 Tax=Ophiobolus disseminans TaxID=1469910 RepID=A0A6A7AKP2_9PLEO|nr:hypothetical protein CC86DRAFT_399910 [Ophiobolus disseminans]